VGGRDPKPPTATPKAQEQYNFTDPESRIMKAGSGAHFEQSYNAQAAVENNGGPTAYVALEKTRHHRTVAELLTPPEPELPTTGPTDQDAMRHRLRTVSGRAAYKKRKETVEPVFGIIKSVMGFRRFLLRGMRKVALEWSRVTRAYNFRRLARLVAELTTRPDFARLAQTA
jgi:hypothetical protein